MSQNPGFPNYFKNNAVNMERISSEKVKTPTPQLYY